MAKLKEKIANKNIHVIEDAAHAFGARYDDGSKVGSCDYSDMTVFSLHPVKSITTGEGGVITTNSYDLYKKLIRLRSHGINKLDDAFENYLLSKSNGETNPWYYEMQELGFNYRLTEIQSVLGISQLKRIDEFIETRAQLAQNYRKAIAGNELMFPAQEVDSVNSANHIFPLRINFAKINKSRREVMTELHSVGIGTQVHYIPIPLHPFYAKKGFSTVDLPEAMSYYHDTLTIPLFPTLRKSQQRKIVWSLENIITS
jgi:dTDP-4-amino-4,6-dideoxygalactose transaminase